MKQKVITFTKEIQYVLYTLLVESVEHSDGAL